MGSTIIFKRLFEIHILHDYFLTTADGTSFFSKSKAQKEELITKKIEQESYDVRNLFDIEPTTATKQLLNSYRLVTAPTALGFMVGVEIESVNKAGEILYKPSFEIDNTINLTFFLKPNASFFKSISNIRLRPPFPAIYYFTNKDKEVYNEISSPSYTSLPISNKASNHQEGMLYEMGALVDFGGTIREALQFTDGTDPTHWTDVDDKRFVNDSDQVVLPNIFNFHFKEEQNIKEAVFVLLNASDNEVKSITKNSTEVLNTVRLDFNKIDENDPNSDVISSGFYKLKVIMNGNIEVLYTIYINNKIYDKNYFAIIDIRLDEQDSPFSLLNDEGYLTTKITSTNEKISHPIFEIRFKNRSTYWRYNKAGDFSPAEVTATSSFLDHQLEKLISQKPKALTESLVPFQNGSAIMLPHPRMPSIKVENDRIFSEIYISQSNRLLNN